MAGMSPASLPHLGLVLDTIAATDSPAPLPHLGMLGGLGASNLFVTAEAGSYSISGQTASSLHGVVLNAETGTLSVNGQVGLLAKSADSSGEAAPFPHLATLFIPTITARTLTCDPGIYSIAGSDALVDHELDSDTATYTFTGQDASLKIGYKFSADFGTYVISGQEADSTRGGPAQVMQALSGSYSIAGQDSQLLSKFSLAATHGFFALLGQPAVLSVGVAGLNNYVVLAEFGSYFLTGEDAQTLFGRAALTAEHGTFLVTGSDASLQSGSAPGYTTMYFWKRIA